MKQIILFFSAILIHVGAYSQGVKVSAAPGTAHSSSILDLESNNKGFLPPRMNTSERDAIASPIAEGLVIFNTTINCLEYYSSGLWYSLCGTCPGPPAPTEGLHISAPYQITWNWNSVPGASGYKYNTSNVYATAIDLGNSITHVQTGLVCASGASLYIWAYNTCGTSTATLLSSSTSACPFVCGNTVSFTYKGNTVNYGTVSHLGECWLDRNLGASQVATSSTDAAAYGDLFQWGRLDDGHQTTSSGITPVLSGTDNPGNANFIFSAGGDWRSPANDNLWQGVSGVNNPCPSGWRLPVNAELDALRASWSSQNAAGAFASPLKLTRSGYRYYANGDLQVVGNQSYLWSSSVDSPGLASILFFDGSSASMGYGGYYRGGGMTVRCILD